MQHALSTADLDYELPAASIATHPARPRDAARMMVVRRSAPDVDHEHVRDLPGRLGPGDALIVNDTAVAPARLVGRRVDSGGRVEGLFLRERDDGGWQVMLRSNGRLRAGQRIELLGPDGQGSAARLELVERDGPTWRARPEAAGAAPGLLDAWGRTPLPPYILRARGDEQVPDLTDRRWYQTVYADAGRRDSVAAPTAGLHFTPALLDRVEAAGCRRLTVTLDVGPGTFRPIEVEEVSAHPMHTERFRVRPATLQCLRERAAGRPARVIAVGTTSVRALESLPDPLPRGDDEIEAETRLLIAPPYTFRHVDGLLTNFHLPRSTLLALVAAMLGLDRVRQLYREAIERGYRFYSYGDAMLILP